MMCGLGTLLLFNNFRQVSISDLSRTGAPLTAYLEPLSESADDKIWSCVI